jgi:hypothetical protein
MHLLVRRRVLWDYLTGALWILPIISVLVFLTALALLGGPGLVIYLVLWIVVPEEPLGAAWQRCRSSPHPCGTLGAARPGGMLDRTMLGP